MTTERATNQTSNVLIGGNTPHILVQPAERYASQQSIVDWFDFWLNNHEEPDPAKTEQYARWRELRKLQQKSQQPVSQTSN